MTAPAPRLFAAHAYGVTLGRRKILQAASIWASPGKVTVLFGRNGCGKTTLIRCALGLIRAEYGSTHFDGVAYPRPQLGIMARRGLFYLPDRTFLPRRGRIRALLDIVGRVHGTSDQVDGLMETLGVADLGGATAVRLSGGEQRRCEWVATLLSNANCIIADEPLAGIEPADRDVLSAALRDAAVGGAAILVTGHDVEPLLAVSDEVVWMTAGTTHGLGTPDQARSHDQFRREYLGPRG